MTEENIKALVLRKAKEGKVCIMTIDGLMEADLDGFISQPTEGILYDLNRDRVTVLSFIEGNPKWINDFAVGLVIGRLKEMVDEKGERPK